MKGHLDLYQLSTPRRTTATFRSLRITTVLPFCGNSTPRDRRARADHGREVDHPPAHAMPERTRSATRPDAAADRLLCMWSTRHLAVPLR